MDNQLRQPLTELAADSMLHVHDGQGRVIVVFEGRVWITQVGDRRDFVLEGGESLAIDRPGLTLVQAFRDSKLMLLDSDPHTARPAAPDSYALQQQAREQRNAAVAELLTKAWATVRGAFARPSNRAPGRPARDPATLCAGRRPSFI